MDSDVNDATEDSLRNDIAAALSAGSEEVKPSEETQPETEAAARARDEAGRFVKKAEEAETEGLPNAAAPVPEQPSNPAPVTRKPPQSWKQELKTHFDTLPPEVQEEIIRRETDYNKGIQRHAESAKYAETIKPVFDKWQPYLNQIQVTPDKAFDALIQAEYTLRTGSPAQKQQAFNKLAADYGIDLGQQQTTENLLDPNVQHALSRVQYLEEQIRNQQFQQQQETQRKQQAEQAALQQQIEEFSSSPNRPHFESVRDDMSKLLQAGYAETLEDAYDRAVWARPDIRSTLLKDEEAKRIQEKAKIAETAKAKAASIKGNPSGAAVPVASASIRDDLRAAIEASGGRL
jgi:hypothetical protein